VPIESTPEPSDIELQLPLPLRDAGVDSIQALSAPLPSSFLIEFDLPAAGLSRCLRNKLEKQGGLQKLAANRHASVAEQHKDFRSFLSDELHVSYALRHEFFSLINGMSIDLQGVPSSKVSGILDMIQSTPGVIKVSPLVSMDQPKAIMHGNHLTTLATTPQISTAHEQTGVLNARNDLKLSGKGIKIGIIGPGCKVQYGRDFVDPLTSNTPGGFDCVGHGTHVAGIIAGNSTASAFFGVAPQATLGAYRVFPCAGNSKDDTIIAALEQAYEDSMDIVNLSLGGGSSWANTPLSKAAAKLVELGVVVVAAVGNDGEQGLSEVSSPSINPRVISVASFEGLGYLANYFELEGVPDSRIDYSDSQQKSLGGATFPLVFPEHDPEGCKPYPSSIEGSIAFLKRGTCTFVLKARLAQEAGAIGCIFYNNVQGGLHPKADDPSVHVFGHGISLQQGQLILDQFKTANKSIINVVYKEEKGVFKNEMANQISTFSSWGLGPLLEMKPDISAPGGYIYSTVANGSFAIMSGTSMATPFVAGSAALLLEAEPSIDRSTVLGRLQTYAKPGVYSKTTMPNTVARQGAGMVNVFDAIQGKAFVQPTHLALNDTVHTKGTYILTLTNQYKSAETFTLTHWPAMSVLGYTPTGQPTDKIVYNETAAELAFDTGNSIRLEPGETRSLTIHFKPPAALDLDSHWIYSGFVKVEPTSSSSRPAFQVPYVGMHGSYGTVDMLDLQDGFPILLGPINDGRLVPIVSRKDQAPQTFSMAGKGVVLVLKISNPLRNLQIYVMDAVRKKIVGMAPMDGEHVGRTDSVRAKFFVVRWSGQVIDKEGGTSKVPEGDYSFVVVAPKPFSVSSSLSDGPHESWMSATIRIKY
ncbi:hypothetical protein BGZ54_002928, partial [Gamsiella multidivaricata]